MVEIGIVEFAWQIGFTAYRYYGPVYSYDDGGMGMRLISASYPTQDNRLVVFPRKTASFVERP